MKTAKQADHEARQLFRLCLVDGRPDGTRVRFVVQEVLQARRRGYLAVLSRFQHLLKLDYSRHTAQIESAVPLSADLRSRVQAGIQDLYGPGIASLFAHNPGLIGGVRIKIGSDVYDNSIRRGLGALARSFGITNGRRAET